MSGLIMLAVILGVVFALLELTHRHRGEPQLAGLGMNDRDALRAGDQLRARWAYVAAPLG
jgi:hypothetical protein